jgi:hypothetical protein
MTSADIITLPVDAAIKAKTAQNALLKFNFTHPSLMYARSPVEILDNIYMGDLAKNALLAYLRAHCTNPIEDYDEVRTDEFKKPDPSWDYKVGKRRIRLEVKSSIPPNHEARASLVANRDIKITASHDNGRTWLSPEKLESEIHAQIYFYAKTSPKGAETFAQLTEILLKEPESIHRLIHSEKYDEPLFFGWSTKKQIIRFARELKPPTWSFGKTSRIYWRCPIKEAFTLPYLIETINTY